METYLGIVGFVIGIAVGWLMCTYSTRSAGPRCNMCGRHDANGLMRWHIRGKSISVCPRCHPFYKSRFSSEAEHEAAVSENHPAEKFSEPG